MKETQILLVLILTVSISIRFTAGRKSCSDKSLTGCHCQPLCGSDGFTYTDECFLNAYNKKCQKDAKVVAPGPCKGKVVLPPVTECYPGDGVCTKNVNKPRNYDPVCSTSGKTYGNPCMFHYERKLNKTGVVFAKCGEC